MNKFPDFDNQKVYVCGLQCFMSNGGGGGGEGGSEWLSSHKEETFIQLITTSAKLL